jgi:hypothetical protein
MSRWNDRGTAISFKERKMKHGARLTITFEVLAILFQDTQHYVSLTIFSDIA